MGTLALGAAFAAVQLVYKAHSKTKTNKARCARLVERCESVVDRLERIATARDGDVVIRERIHELERAFEYTAQTIFHVGQQSVITSLLRSETNALRIESCNEALTELISLFTLEESVDARRWQSDLDATRRRDHQELLSMGQRIESGNVAIIHELAQQGATIAEVLRVLNDIGAGANCARETIELPSSSSAARPAVTPLPAPDDAPPFSTLAPCASSESAKSKPKLRRLSTKRMKMAIFSKLPPSPSRARSAARDALCARTPLALPLEPICPAVAGGATVAHDCAVDLPPPYQLYAANPEREDLGDGAAVPVSPSRFTTITSIEAVRAPDSPVPLFPSPKLSTESVFGSTQSLASLSGILPGPQCPHRSPIARVPELKRKDTMRSRRRSAMTYTRVQPVLWGT
ncbi:hypothetical protein EDB92DRAFT_1812953 [Lactarius akahatsu]|uniref:Mixed lineage kinase domain-containing protein n=1 Tax=Lactarius akahatsu TaxID=416441 RepID=A0AAD4QH42_9AGAM|nr:hypothetical protein EDB92DRAFT_1812953 [Lactarius akahatsu]